MITKTIERNTGNGFTPVESEILPIEGSTDYMIAQVIGWYTDIENNVIEVRAKVTTYDEFGNVKTFRYESTTSRNVPETVEIEIDENGDYVQDIGILIPANNRIDELDELFKPTIPPLLIASIKKHLGYM